MRFDVLTLFPDLVRQAMSAGVVGRALEKGRIELNCWNPRDYTEDNYRTVDDRPYGGGPGMVMMAEPLARCLRAVQADRAAVEAAQGAALPSSKFGKAIQYTLGLWPKLERFLNHPVLELSNNLAENSMRPVALGRKNWIHVGSAQAGPKVAAILSVVETCRRLGIPVREYLTEVLPGLEDVSIRKVAELTPVRWADRRG